MNSAEGLKDEEAGIFNEVLQASNQEEVIHKNLKTERVFHIRAVQTLDKQLFLSTMRFKVQVSWNS